MKRLFIGVVGAIALTGGTIGIINVARANSPKYQQKMNDELIAKISKSIEESDVCKSMQKFKESNTPADSIDIAMAASCARLISSHSELFFEIPLATSNKERREYKKDSDLMIAKSILWAVRSIEN